MRFIFKTDYRQDLELAKHGGHLLWYGVLLLLLLAAPWLFTEYWLAQLTFVLIYSIAALGIMLRRGEDHRVGATPIRVRPVAAERSHFDLALFAVGFTVDENHAERFADGACLIRSKDRPNLIGRGIGRDIEIVRIISQNGISNTTTCKIGDITVFDQSTHDLMRELFVRS